MTRLSAEFVKDIIARIQHAGGSVVVHDKAVLLNHTALIRRFVNGIEATDRLSGVGVAHTAGAVGTVPTIIRGMGSSDLVPTVDEMLDSKRMTDEELKAHLQRLLGGEYGRKGLRAHVTRIDRQETQFSFDMKVHRPWDLRTYLWLRDPNVTEVGRIQRIVYRNPESAGVLNAGFVMDPAWRRTGFGKDFSERSEQVFREAGVDHMCLRAEYEMGPWTWYQAGYKLDPSAEHHNRSTIPEGLDAVAGRPEITSGQRAALTEMSNRIANPANPMPTLDNIVAELGEDMAKQALLATTWRGWKSL